MADEPDYLVGLLTGMPFSGTAEEVADIDTGKTSPVSITSPTKTEYQPFKW